MRGSHPIRRVAIVLWGVLGVAFVLVEAIVRLSAIAIDVFRAERPSAAQAAVLAGWTVVIWYFEAYRGFQKRFSPRVVARALWLADHGRALQVALAPLHTMALFHATRRRLVASWILVAGIVTIVLLVRTLPPIWRAIVDAGVALALAWGTAAMLVYMVRGLAGRPMPVPPDVPGDEPAGADLRAARAPVTPGRSPPPR